MIVIICDGVRGYASKALIGTPEYTRVLSWLGFMGISLNDVALSHVDDIVAVDGVTFESHEYSGNYAGLVTLGASAHAKFCKTHGDYLSPFKLPHPNPKNLKLNNKIYEKEILDKCSDFIKSKCEGYSS